MNGFYCNHSTPSGFRENTIPPNRIPAFRNVPLHHTGLLKFNPVGVFDICIRKLNANRSVYYRSRGARIFSFCHKSFICYKPFPALPGSCWNHLMGLSDTFLVHGMGVFLLSLSLNFKQPVGAPRWSGGPTCELSRGIL